MSHSALDYMNERTYVCMYGRSSGLLTALSIVQRVCAPKLFLREVAGNFLSSYLAKLLFDFFGTVNRFISDAGSSSFS